MKNYCDSDYAVNKTASGIVYRFADQTVEVKLDDYLRENPDKTAADFAELKALSDEMYLEQIRADTAQGKKTVSIHDIEETSLVAAPSPEDSFIDAMECAANNKRRCELAAQALDKLTDIQRRRYLLHYVEGLSTWEIARREGVNQSKIMKSLDGAEKKIKKVLTDG